MLKVCKLILLCNPIFLLWKPAALSLSLQVISACSANDRSNSSLYFISMHLLAICSRAL